MAFVSISLSNTGVIAPPKRLSGDSVRDSISSTFERSRSLISDAEGVSPQLAKELSFPYS
jgi:hypothetical protein